MFGPLWFLSLEILYFGLCFNKNISFIQKKKKKKAEKGFEETYCWTAKPRRCGATIEDVAETYTYFSLQIRRINLEIREKTFKQNSQCIYDTSKQKHSRKLKKVQK